MRSCLTICAALVCVAVGLPARAGGYLYHAPTDFSPTDNPAGVWSYGWTPRLGGSFSLYASPNEFQGVRDLTGWMIGGAIPYPDVVCNVTDRVIPYKFAIWEPLDLTLHPGPVGEHSVVRWTAPADGFVLIYVAFAAHDRSGRGDTTVHVLGNGKSLFDGRVHGYDQPESFQEFFTEDLLWIKAGDTIDFVVGPNGRYEYDTTKADPWVYFVPVK